MKGSSLQALPSRIFPQKSGLSQSLGISRKLTTLPEEMVLLIEILESTPVTAVHDGQLIWWEAIWRAYPKNAFNSLTYLVIQLYWNSPHGSR